MQRRIGLPLLVALIFLFFSNASRAGDLNPPAPPDEAGSAMHTLEDIHQRLDTGAGSEKRSGGFTEPAQAPGATGVTLDDIYELIPPTREVQGLSPGDVPCGKFFWSLRPESWGLREGMIGAITWYSDGDGDQYSNGNTLATCQQQPDGYYPAASLTATAGDCDDTNAAIHPAAQEICGNGVDENCDGNDALGSMWYVDDDGDGYGDTSDSIQACVQPGGYVADDTDCNDANVNIHPAAVDICDNGVDEDCDGSDSSGPWWYADGDGDGYGDAGVSVQACEQPDGYVADDSDCNDSDPDVNPGAVEICDNHIDDNCNPGDCPERVILYMATPFPYENGDMGGHQGADQICSQSLNKPLGQTVARAFISGPNQRIRDLGSILGIDQQYTPIEGGCENNGGNLTCSQVSPSWDGLWAGSLGQSLANAGVLPAGQKWWSGSNAVGNRMYYQIKTLFLFTCEDVTIPRECMRWTLDQYTTFACTADSSDGPYIGRVGSADRTDGGWIDSGDLGCDERAALICLSVGERH